MDFIVIDLKEVMPTVEMALAMVEIEIENSKKAGTKLIKVVHGYGSHGVGGAIFVALRQYLKEQRAKKLIKDFLSGEEWTLENTKTQQMLIDCKNCYNDCDLGKRNPGITIIKL